MTEEERKCLIESGEWRQWVVREAHEWLGTKYVHKGKIKGVSADCGGLLYGVYNPIFVFPNPFPHHYAIDWAIHRNDELYLDWIAPVTTPVPAPVFGGISVFRMGRAFAHGAIYVGDNKYIHAFGRQRSGSVMLNNAKFFHFQRSPVKHFDLKVIV